MSSEECGKATLEKVTEEDYYPNMPDCDDVDETGKGHLTENVSHHQFSNDVGACMYFANTLQHKTQLHVAKFINV